ncbi:MAG: ADP-glyceromanno-heptose 6-epimerase [Candidatus Omnitrophota bacterium]|nr:ADP-glyceromanno-heptose 6-epimerase [Candidatus Omnitrophota bacterium]
MKIILTGGAGFIGSCLLSKLNAKGIDDIIIVDKLGSSDKWKNLEGKKFEDYIDKDRFLDYLESNRIIGPVDTVIHMGACTSTVETNASYMLENNYSYSKRLCSWALKNKAHFLYASSAATYGDGKLGYSDMDAVTLTLHPLNIYGYSKHLFDLWLIKNKLIEKVTGFKFFNVFGPNEYHKEEMRSVIAKSFTHVVKSGVMKLFMSYRMEYADGEQKRDFIYVKDAVEMVYYFIENLNQKGIFNIGTGQARTWKDVAGALFATLDKKPQVEYVPMPETIRDKYQYFTQAETDKLKAAGCRHKCMSLEDAVKDYAGYLENQSYL